ncbi:MAG: amidohydrolase [Gammaproteobacteria bacterium]
MRRIRVAGISTRIRFAAIVLAACLGASAFASADADLIFVHANVIPMTGPDIRAQALAVKNGRIVAVGSDTEVERHRGRATRVIDLRGRTMLPGFIDAHGHLAGVAQRSGHAKLDPPPVGPVADIASLQDALRARARASPDGWIVGSGYDDAQLAEGRHPTRQELDQVSVDRPILAFHVSGHLAALNTRALEIAGMLHPVQDPPGGVIRREDDGATASGVVEESAVFAAYARMPQASLDERLEWLKAAQYLYAQNGLTTAQDGATTPDGWALLQEAARRNALFIDVHALPLAMAKWPDLDRIAFNAPYDRHLRAAGIKIIADGSPQGRTAWLSRPYRVPPPGRGAGYAGYRQIPDEVFRATLMKAAGRGWQVFVHVNGDAAIQQLIDGVRAIAADGRNPLRRTIAIHAQTARRDQLEQMKALDIEPSFFAAHTYYWGDWHREVVLGPERAERISPQREAFDIGLHPTIHNDAPVVPPDMARLIWSAVTRRTRSNDILGAAGRVTPYEALEEVTVNAAYQIHEEAAKGRLEPGKLADLVVLDADPLSVPAEQLPDLRVVATIKEGRLIHGGF